MWAREKATRAEKQSAALAKAEAEAEQSSGTRGAVGDGDEEEKSEEKSEDEEEKEEEEEREIDDDEPQEESDEARPRATTTKKVNAKKAAKPKSATAEDEEGVRYRRRLSVPGSRSVQGCDSPDVCLVSPHWDLGIGRWTTPRAWWATSLSGCICRATSGAKSGGYPHSLCVCVCVGGWVCACVRAVMRAV